MARLGRTIARGLAFILAFAVVPVVAADHASAGVTSIDTTYRCLTSAFGTTFDGGADAYTVTISAPANVEEGSTAVVRWTISDGLFPLPFDITNLTTSTSSEIEVSVNGAAATPYSDADSVTTPTDVPAGDPIAMARSFAVTLPISQVDGDTIEIRPGPLTVTFDTADDDLTDATTTCTPDPDVVTDPAVIQVHAPAGDDDCETVSGICILPSAGDPYTDGDLQVETRVASGNPDVRSIDLGGVTTGTATQTVVGAINPLRVTDLRTGAFGWSLTAYIEDDATSTGGNTIATDKFELSGISCEQAPGAHGSAPVAAGGGGKLDHPVTLCSADSGSVGSGGSGRGQYDIDATLSMKVPAFAQAGNYSAVLVVNLS